MINSDFIKEYGMTTEEYFESIQEKYLPRWEKKFDQVNFNSEIIDFLEENYLPIHIVVFSAEWCPDCQNAVPIVMKFAEKSEYISISVIDRDEHKEQLEGYEVNGGLRVPLVLFMNSNFEELNRWVERSSLAYEYLLEAKREAISQETDDYAQFSRAKFRENSDLLFEENLKELFFILKKSVILRSATAKLDEFNQILAI